MHSINWDKYEDDDVYSENHDIEEDYKIQEEIAAGLINEDDTQNTPLRQHSDFNSHTQKSLHDFFKGGTTHIAQSRRGKYHQKHRAPRNLMISMWNPLSIVQTDRTTDISMVLQKLDIIGLIGTQSKASSIFPEHRVEQLPHHYALHFGTDTKAKLSNKSAGVSLLLDKRFSPSSIRRIQVPPQELRGRGAIVRIKQGSCDITIILLYFPPPPQTTEHVLKYHMTCTKLMRWVTTCLAQINCGSSTEIILTDANSPFGNVDDHTSTSDDNHVGYHGIGKERFPATLLWELMTSRQLHVVDFFHPCGPTYYSPTYATSNPDHIIAPVQLKSVIKKVEIWHGVTRKLQMIPGAYIKDHAVMVLTVEKIVPQAPQNRGDTIRWDYKKMATACDQDNSIRQAFLHD